MPRLAHAKQTEKLIGLHPHFALNKFVFKCVAKRVQGTDMSARQKINNGKGKQGLRCMNGCSHMYTPTAANVQRLDCKLSN